MGDLGLDADDPSSLPWWRRGKAKTGEPAFDQVVIRENELTEVIDHTKTDGHAFGVDLLEDLERAESAVKRFTGGGHRSPGHP